MAGGTVASAGVVAPRARDVRRDLQRRRMDDLRAAGAGVSVHRRIAPLADDVLPFVGHARRCSPRSGASSCTCRTSACRARCSASSTSTSTPRGRRISASSSRRGRARLFLWRGGAEHDRLAIAGRRGRHAVLHHGARDGPDLGAADLGHVVDLGSAPHDDRDPVDDLRGLPRAAPVGRDDPQIARYAAVLALVGVLDIPLIHGVGASVARHAPVGDLGAGEQGRTRGSAHGDRRCSSRWSAFALLFAWLLWLRYEGLRLRDELHRLEDQLGRARSMSTPDRFWYLVRGIRRDLDPARDVPHPPRMAPPCARARAQIAGSARAATAATVTSAPPLRE